MLNIIPTPIGNLKDITLRSLDTLKNCDYVLCEDTRKTGFLLHHFEISKKLVPFHKHNEKKLEEKILQDLSQGKNICLVSDAGTPSINDPGASLIAACHEKKLAVYSLPGASSVVTALALSGLIYDKFQFLGFFPKTLAKQKSLIETILNYDGVSIFFESPNRIMKTIGLFPEQTKIMIAKELSKMHEALIITNPKDAPSFEEKLSRGEMCVLISGKEKAPFVLNMEDQNILKILCKHLSNKDAIKVASELTGKKKQHFYSLEE
jgi:16S rRNA (cytidine1402-2'-O)-methyltransferase